MCVCAWVECGCVCVRGLSVDVCVCVCAWVEYGCVCVCA